LDKILKALMVATTVAILAVPAFAGEPIPAPEPGTMALLASGIGGVAVLRRLLKR
jgi:predicted secreted protein